MARLRYLQNARTGTAGTISKDTKPIQFYDDDMYIYASADGVLEIVSDTTLTLTAPTINLTSSTVSAFTYPISITFNCTATNASDLTITSVSSSTSTSVVIKPLYVDATMSATGGLGRAIEGKLTVTGKLGDYGNAIKGYTDLTGGTGCTGLVSAVCAEMKMPASTALGTHAVLEIELVMPTSAVIQQGIGSNCTSFIRARVSDNSTAVQSFNDYGYLLDLQGLTTGSTDLFDTCTLKCAIGSTKYYLLLSTATASFTTASPIVSSAQIKTTLSTGVAMYVNSTATAAGSYGMYSLVTGTYTSGGCWAIYGDITWSHATSGYPTMYGVCGRATVNDNYTGGTGYVYAVSGELHFTNDTIINNSSSVFAALCGVITSDASPTFTTGHITCLYLDNLCDDTDLADTAGVNSFVYMANNSGGKDMDDAIYLYGPNVSSFIRFQTCSNLISATATTSGTSKKIKCSIDGVTYYLNAYTG